MDENSCLVVIFFLNDKYMKILDSCGGFILRGTTLKVPLLVTRGKQSSHSVLCTESVKHWSTPRQLDISLTHFKYRNTADNGQFSL